jgi:hypothetical protein
LVQETGDIGVRLDGYDIDLSQCPSPIFSPSNVCFEQWNALDEVAPELYEAYDLVHIRLFQINIKDNDASKLVQNCFKMLGCIVPAVKLRGLIVAND